MKRTVVLIIVAVLIIGAGIGGYLYWSKKAKTMGEDALDKIGDAADKITDSITKGVLPSIQTNLLENKPDINPADKANPYKDIKTNPFE